MFHSSQSSGLQQPPSSRRQARSSQRNGYVPYELVNDNYSGRFAPITLAARGLV